MRRVELKDPPVTIFGRDYATYGTLTKIVFLCKLISWLLCIDEARRSVQSTFTPISPIVWIVLPIDVSPVTAYLN